MRNLSLNELKLIPKSRDIKDYKGKSEEDLIKILSELKPKINLAKKKIKEIEKNFSKLKLRLSHRFSKSKINKFRRSLYDIKIRKNLSTPEMKETKKNLLEIEKSLCNLQKYYDHDDNQYQEIGDIGNLVSEFDEVDEDYYKPKKTKSAFNGNYIEYESKGDKDKNLSPEEYFDIIRPYLRDMINDYKTRREWKIQLTIQINLFL